MWWRALAESAGKFPDEKFTSEISSGEILAGESENSMQRLWIRGLVEFNQGLYYDCHETLEAYWKTQSLPEKELTQGIIQIAVGQYHLGRGNVKGALKLFDRGAGRLAKFLPSACGLELVAAHRAVVRNIELLQSGCLFDDPRLTIPIIENK